MKQFMVAVAWVICIILPAVPVSAQNSVITLQGELSIEDEDAQGNPTEVSFIYWDDEGEYQMCKIAPGVKAKELLKLTDQTLSITCTRTMGADGSCTISVKKYEIVEAPETEPDTDADTDAGTDTDTGDDEGPGETEQ